MSAPHFILSFVTPSPIRRLWSGSVAGQKSSLVAGTKDCFTECKAGSTIKHKRPDGAIQKRIMTSGLVF